jgi:hypothetical protein
MYGLLVALMNLLTHIDIMITRAYVWGRTVTLPHVFLLYGLPLRPLFLPSLHRLSNTHSRT